MFFDVSPCTFSPNSWQHNSSIYFLTRVTPNISLFHSFYTFKKHPQSAMWWYASPWKRKGVPLLIQCTHSAIHDWKERYFFIFKTSSEAWGFVNWDEHQASAFRVPGLDQYQMEEFQALCNFQVPTLRELLSEQIFYNIRISPTNLQDARRSKLLPLAHPTSFIESILNSNFFLLQRWIRMWGSRSMKTQGD